MSPSVEVKEHDLASMMASLKTDNKLFPSVALMPQVEAAAPTTSAFNAQANLCSIAPELVLHIFKKLWESDDLVSSLCLGLTCKSFKSIHDERTINKRVVKDVERSYRALTTEEQLASPKGVIVVFPKLRELLLKNFYPYTELIKPNPAYCPHDDIQFARWGKDVLLKREGNSDIFGLYADFCKSTGSVPKLTFKSHLNNSFEEPIRLLYIKFQRKEWEFELLSHMKTNLPSSLERVGKWTVDTILNMEYDGFKSKNSVFF